MADSTKTPISGVHTPKLTDLLAKLRHTGSTTPTTVVTTPVGTSPLPVTTTDVKSTSSISTSTTTSVAASDKNLISGVSASYTAGGATCAELNSNTAKIKVNFVPTDELKQIVGIGEKISKRMHLMRLVQGNLTPQKLKKEFGGKMSDTMLSQMDFEKSDMLIDRKSTLTLPANLIDSFNAVAEKDGKSTKEKSKHVIKKKMKTKPTKVKAEETESDTTEAEETESNTSQSEKHVETESDISEIEDDVIKFKNKPKRVKSKQQDKEQKHKTKTKKTKKSKKIESSDISETDIESEQEVKSKRKHKKKSKRKPNIETSDSSETNSESDVQIKRKHKKKSKHKRLVTSDSSSDDEVTSLQKVPKGFDKHLRFSGDGKGDDFDSFKLKFKSYKQAYNWTEEECRYCLCWSLQGAAAKYHTLISSGEGPLTYKQLMKKLEKRFGGRELIETAQARFNQACQEQNETLEVWADRVQMLSLRAFRKVSEDYAASQAVNRFCLGLLDKDASKDACLKRFKTMDEAKDYVHYYLHINSTSTKSKSSRRSSSREQEEAVNVYETSMLSQNDFRKEIQRLQQYFDKKLSMQINRGRGSYGRGQGYQQQGNNRYNGTYGRSYRGRGDWGRPSRGRGRGGNEWWNKPTQETGGRNNSGAGPNECYHCGETGHLRSDCKKWWETQECFFCHQFGHRKSNCPEMNKAKNNLNEKGSGPGAKLDSQ